MSERVSQRGSGNSYCFHTLHNVDVKTSTTLAIFGRTTRIGTLTGILCKRR